MIRGTLLGCEFMRSEAAERSTCHVTVQTRHRPIGDRTVIPLTDDTRDLASMFFFIIIVLQTFGTKVGGREESCDAGDSVKVIINQVEVDARPFGVVCLDTREELVPQTRIRIPRTSSNAGKSFKLAGRSSGTSAKRQKARRGPFERPNPYSSKFLSNSRGHDDVLRRDLDSTWNLEW